MLRAACLGSHSIPVVEYQYVAREMGRGVLGWGWSIPAKLFVNELNP